MSNNILKLPGFIDVHVHVREPGATYKENFSSCTAAALAGGITMICAMPNTTPPLVDRNSYDYVQELARVGAHCDYALYVGATPNNCDTAAELSSQAASLKMYLDDTFSTFKLDDMTLWHRHLQNWPKKLTVCAHTEKEKTATIILIASLLDRPIHICHVTKVEEIMIIKAAKEQGLKVTCEVCPHHLFLTTADVDRIGYGFCEVRPVLCSPRDQAALWENMNVIDIFTTDHSPHAVEEKYSENSPSGFPGLETILPLLLNAVNEGRLTIDDIIDKFHKNPRKIFNLPKQPNTYVEVDMDYEWTIPPAMEFTKSKWTPFAGMKLRGIVRRVILRGDLAYADGQILVRPGFGQNVRDWPSLKVDKKEKDTPIHSKHDHSVRLKRSVLFGKSVLTVDIFGKEILNDILNLTRFMKTSLSKGRCLDNILGGKVMATIFYEASTRTICSFTAAMQRLGGSVIHTDAASSSAKKGESFEDSVTVMARYADIVVIRHPKPGAISLAAQTCNKPIINAGDGVGDHRTQALLDIFTIHEEMETVDGLTVTMAGDLKHGRAVHSLARLLATHYQVNLQYISPPGLEMPKHIMDYVSSKGISQEVFERLEDVIADTHVLYMTRIARERFESEEEYEKVRAIHVVTPQLLARGRRHMVVLHPLPRVDEVVPQVDADPRAAYFRQAENGMYVRMALLTMVAGFNPID